MSGVHPGEAARGDDLAGSVELRLQMRRVVALAVVAGLLGLAVIRLVLPLLDPPPAALPSVPLLAIDPAQVRELVVTRGGVTGRLAREGSGWKRIGTPDGGTAVQAEPIEGFLRTASTLGRLGEFVETDLPAFGLDPPRGEVELIGPDSSTIRIGDRNPPLTALYVQVLPGADIVLVGSVLLWEFDKLAALVPGQTVREAQQAESPENH